MTKIKKVKEKTNIKFVNNKHTKKGNKMGQSHIKIQQTQKNKGRKNANYRIKS